MPRRPGGTYSAASMADIAFLLLIFFLVATTMDVDSGLSRKLPPMPTDEPTENNPIKERNIFVVLINANDQLMVEGKPMSVFELRKNAKEFLENPLNREDLPEKKLKDIPFFGQVEVTKGIISLQNDRGTSYGMYIKVQNELAAAYNELRDELAMRKFGRKFADLNKEQSDAISDIYPQVISEAEPKNIGGK